MIECEICGKNCKNFLGLSSHIRRSHNITSEDYYLKYIGDKRICPECSKKTNFISINEGYRKFCSTQCSIRSKETREKIKKTCLKNFGVDHNFKSNQVIEKRKKKFLNNYGVENPFQSEEIKEKIKQTCLKKYGVEYSSQSEEIKEKKKQTCLNSFGVEYLFQSKDLRKKGKQTCLKKYGVEFPSQSKQIKKRIEKSYKENYCERLLNSDRLKDKVIPLFNIDLYKGTHYKNKYLFKCKKCDTEFKDHLYSGHIPRCPICYPFLFCSSSFEQEIGEFCKVFFPNLIENDRSILEGKELDIYIFDINLAIECNGLYYHSEKMKKNKYYHFNKTSKCNKKGIKLIHIFEDEWNENKNRIKKILLKEMKIIPRKTNFKEKMIIDRRFSDGDYLLENGYKLVESIEPRCYYVDGIKRYKNKISNNKIWDCGQLVFEKS